MKITLEKDEIEQALKEYVTSQINIAEGQTISINLGNNTATIDISNNVDNSTNKPKVGRPKKTTVEKIEPETFEVENEVTQEEEVVDNTTVDQLHSISTGEERVEPAVEENHKVTANILEDTPEPPGPARSSSSLFANLKRPNNAT